MVAMFTHPAFWFSIFMNLYWIVAYNYGRHVGRKEAASEDYQPYPRKTQIGRLKPEDGWLTFRGGRLVEPGNLGKE